jgi:hypothetical protein
MAFMDIVFFFPTMPQTSTPDMNYTVVVLGGVLVLSIVWYYFPVYGGVHWFTGPVPNVDAAEGTSKDSSLVDRQVGMVVDEKRVEVP